MKKSMRNRINLIFSSFLVIGFIVCSYFFSTMANQLGGWKGALVQALILFVFGLLLFYATRVGEGKQVRRFSLEVLILVVLPCAYILAASFVDVLPLHEQIASVPGLTIGAEEGGTTTMSILTMLAAVGIGYAIPYTFFSGYEIKVDNEEAEETEEEAEELPVVEGGIAEELAEAEAEDDAADEAEEAPAEEAEEEADEE